MAFGPQSCLGEALVWRISGDPAKPDLPHSDPIACAEDRPHIMQASNIIEDDGKRQAGPRRSLVLAFDDFRISQLAHKIRSRGSFFFVQTELYVLFSIA